MLNKENLLVRSSLVNEWRKLYVGRRLTGNIDDEYDIYGFDNGSYGYLSDRFLNEREISSIDSIVYRASSNYDYTAVIFSERDVPAESTLYLKRKDKETIALVDETGRGYYYRKSGVTYFTKDDWGNTIDIYVGFTPPPKRKIKRTLQSRRVLSC
jgi:hypothetical protein